jgi:uncharacterized protein (TIGR00106 family)
MKQCFLKEAGMIAEIHILPVGVGGRSLSGYVAKAVKIIKESGLRYRLGEMGTVVEGSWDEITNVAKKCHEAVLKEAGRIITQISFDDRLDKPTRIEGRIEAVEKQL